VENELNKYLKSIGVTNAKLYIKSLRDFEAYIRDNYPKVFNKAWDIQDDKKAVQ